MSDSPPTETHAATGGPDGSSRPQAGALPNLLVIGAPKCGTTSLHHYLDAHPEIAMSEVKELDFFAHHGAFGGSATWERGVEWYMTNFDPAAKVRGESSTSYTRGHLAEAAAERAASVLDMPRLIYMVRDPIRRIPSDYHQYRSFAVEDRGLAEACADPESPYVLASSYATQLAPYIERFGIERILVETQERLLAERRESLRRIFRFLEVDDDVQHADFDRLWNQSEGKGWGYTLGAKLSARGLRAPRVLRQPIQRVLRSSLVGGSSEAAKPPEMDEETHVRLVETLSPEVERLRQMTGMEFGEWSL